MAASSSLVESILNFDFKLEKIETKKITAYKKGDENEEASFIFRMMNLRPLIIPRIDQ